MTGRASLAEWQHGRHLVLLTAIGITCVPTTLPVYTIGLVGGPAGGLLALGRYPVDPADMKAL